jgi:hypothetical protein
MKPFQKQIVLDENCRAASGAGAVRCQMGQAWCSSRFIFTAAVAALACFTEAFPAYQKRC